MFKKLFLTGTLVFALTSSVFARGDSITNIPIDKLDELAASPTVDTDFIPVWDASANKDKKLDVDRIIFTDPTTGSFTIPGTSTTGAGTKHDGFVTLDAGEITTAGTAIGTLTTLNLSGTNSYALEATVLGQGPTATTLVAHYFCTGTFYRIGSGAAVRVGTATPWLAETTHLAGGNAAAWFEATGSEIHLRVRGSDTSAMEWGGTVKYISLDAN